MQKWIPFLMTLLVGTSVSYANTHYYGDANGCCAPQCCNNNDTQICFEAGYRQDNLSWNVKVPSCDPLFEVSTKFKNVDIFQIGFNAKTNLGCNFYGRAGASWGWIFDGDFHESFKFFVPFSDSDFNSNIDDIQITSKGKNILDDKYVLNFNAAIGYPFYFCDCTMALAPVLGYSFDEQNIHIESNERHGDFFGSDFFDSPSEGCCDAKHIFRWYGPFVGADFYYKPHCDCWAIYANVEYHWAHMKYKRHDFSGFSGFNDFDTTSRHAHGWSAVIGADYEFCGCWTFGANVKYQDWSATRHHHDCFGSESSAEFKTNAHWHSYALNLTLGYAF